ncbi:MAG: CRISPR-associated endonuclease Cas2 [Methanothrix sp.]
MARLVPFGEPVHYSVFRCDLTRLGRAEMASALIDLIDEGEDRIMIIWDLRMGVWRSGLNFWGCIRRKMGEKKRLL